MSDAFVDLGDGFWTIRGSFRIGGVFDVGTQCSLVRLASGNFVFLDSYTLPDAIRAQVDELTGGGAKVEAVLNLHPFHTVHCEWMHETFPQAKHYGTARHLEIASDLGWQELRCEDDALMQLYADDFAFSIPRGVPLVSDDDSVHFSSVLALHRASGTVHVDDTFVFLRKGFPISLLPFTGRFGFHPTLAKALEPRAGAADEFREWAIGIGVDWADARRIAAAHNAVLELDTKKLPDLIGEALGRVKPILDAHRAQHG
ncbi:MAG: hypothetical protein JJ901_14905 [Erythrobacter sp.]|uniref:hypothetical protein n=1 Tax=Erythrobacter sp. TaxID=1042 RepID=UPI001B259159|nr:hypothetical protein [Erythrobacter sp.]MBO6769579.1 hypothetical protein [Erythrobacter sp.]